MRLADEVIVVTGANGGLGRAMAEAFLAEGADIVFADLPESGVVETVESMAGTPGTARAVEVDVRAWAQVRRLIETTLDALDRIDVLVNNAGVQQLSFAESLPVVDVPVERWERVVDTNLTGAFHCAKAALRPMLDAGSGRLIHITTGIWPDGMALRAPYAASKFGLEGLARSLALELADTGVESLLLEPGGPVDTGIVAHLDPADRGDRLEPSVIAEPAVRLAAGEGENGGRYVATEMHAGSDAT